MKQWKLMKLNQLNFQQVLEQAKPRGRPPEMPKALVVDTVKPSESSKSKQLKTFKLFILLNYFLCFLNTATNGTRLNKS